MDEAFEVVVGLQTDRPEARAHPGADDGSGAGARRISG